MKQLFVLPLLLMAGVAAAQTFPTMALKNSGPVDKRVNIAILPDGFQPAQLVAFDSTADTTARKIFLQTPMKEYANFFNVYCINVPSIDSGVDHPATATDVTEPVIPFSNVNTFFDCTFDDHATHRALVCNNTAAAYAVMATNFPSYDQIIMLSNSFEYGGTGGPVATFSRNSSLIETALHELGHSFAHLADEYWPGWGSEKPNMTQQADTALIVWHNWLGVPAMGHFAYGTTGESATWYRPHQNCKMRYLNSPFCHVCQEAFIDRIYSLVTPIDSVWPDNSGVTLFTGTPLTFHMKLVKPQPNTLKVRWEMNGFELPSTDSTVTINTSMMHVGANNLMAFVTDTTLISRTYRPGNGYLFTAEWTINSTVVGVADISVAKTGQHFFYKMYPVPAHDELHISCDNATGDNSTTLTLTDMSGRVVKTTTLALTDGKQELTVNIAGLTPGSYIASLRSHGIHVDEQVVVE